MAKKITTDADLTSIANAIRTKGGTSSSLEYPAGFVSAINAIPTGGGGLPYETGTYIPASDTTSTVINFQGTHTDPPFCYMVFDCDPESITTGYAAIGVTYYNNAQILGSPTYYGPSSVLYGSAVCRYGGNSAPTSGTGSNALYHLYTPYDDPESYNTNKSQYWSTNTGIKLDTNGRTFIAGRTYKWIAIWTP